MSKKILVFAVLLSLVASITITQEANALTQGAGQYSRTTASLDPSRVCGNHICQPGEHSKWSSAMLSSQRQGPGKATGSQYGIIIMHQLFVNSLTKVNYESQMPWSHTTMSNSTNMKNSTGMK